MVVVEPDRAACLFHSMEIGDGKPHSFPGDLDTIMAGLACGDPNPIAWEVLYDCADGFIKCPDYVSAKGMRVGGVPLHGDPYIIAGESGAVSLGALMFIMELERYKSIREALGLDENSRVLLVNQSEILIRMITAASCGMAGTKFRECTAFTRTPSWKGSWSIDLVYETRLPA